MRNLVKQKRGLGRDAEALYCKELVSAGKRVSLIHLSALGLNSRWQVLGE